MPILVEKGPQNWRIYPGKNDFDDVSHLRDHRTNSEWIAIGLVNNMPDAALENTETQFLELLSAAAEHRWIHLRLFSLPDIPRTERGRGLLSKYCNTQDLWKADLDGLIVTGTEPKATNLTDEPYWRTFTELVDWADYNTISTIWSCLAAHAAVLHLDGIRQSLLVKNASAYSIAKSLMFIQSRPICRPDFTRRTQDATTCRRELAARDYRVLTRSREAGVDIFVQQQHSLFVFCQGHPEYDSRSLLNEYRRDVGRFLKKEREDYPVIPRDYFDTATAEAMSAFQRRAVFERQDLLMEDFPAVLAEPLLANTWFASSVRIYRNWLSHILAEKIRRFNRTQSVTPQRVRGAPVDASS